MRAGKQVQEQTLALELLVPQLPVGAILVRSDGTVAAANDRGRTLLGGGEAARLGAVRRALQGDATHSERLHRRGDGGRIVVDVVAVPLRAEHGGVLVLLTDVTEQARRERAEADFVENAAHQLRTPVAAIASSVAALEAGARDAPEERDRFLAHIGRESRRLSGLVDSLLRLAGLQRGDGRTVVELLPLGALVAEALGDAALAADVECAAEIAVIGDRELLVQALGNVLANAARHTDERGIRVRCSRDRAHVSVDITDFGPGVARRDRDRLFDRFYRSATNGSPGSGLGLAVARAAAEAMDATLELLAPVEGEGATFRFTIPAAKLL
jgi:signal transduction histidine kinase